MVVVQVRRSLRPLPSVTDLAATPGNGPDYGHFVSKDFIHWAPLPVAIWNGLDSSVWPPRETPYDNEAIFTGSAIVVDGAGPDGKGPGVVNIYPGLCNKNDWPSCTTGTLLAQAVPANYVSRSPCPERMMPRRPVPPSPRDTPPLAPPPPRPARTRTIRCGMAPIHVTGG